MTVMVLHHGRCFDGAASAALFSAFYAAKIDPTASFVFRPKQHSAGDPFEDADFEADTVACLDFRYTARPGLDWYFDHHVSAFQLPGERAHFDAVADGRQKFHDAAAPSCAGFMARTLERVYGFDLSKWSELIHWAEIIDTASFENPSVPVAMEAPALRLAAFIQSADSPTLIDRFIRDLIERPFHELAELDYVDAVVQTRLAAHREDIRRIAEVGRVDAGVFEYDLLDGPPRVLSHFIPYAQAPDVEYVVGAYPHSDGDLRVTVGFNPWLPAGDRRHDLASLCEAYGGGGHPFVAGCSFAVARIDDCRRAQREISAKLRSATPAAAKATPGQP